MNESITELASKMADFDPSITFSDGTRLINDPLDEVYLQQPGSSVTKGMLPREEHEVSAAIVEMKMFTEKLSEFGFIRRRTEKQQYVAARDLASSKQAALRALVNQTPQHQAALKRIMTQITRNPGFRQTLSTYIDDTFSA